MILCDFVCILQLFSYLVLYTLKLRLIKVTKLKIDMWITLHIIFKLHIIFMIHAIQLYLYSDLC
jgi:hypothetical protein